jgi:hypothetical protein
MVGEEKLITLRPPVHESLAQSTIKFDFATGAGS